MCAATDPFYNRKPVPNELIEGVGFSGLTPQQETTARERKFSRDTGDLRHFSNPKTKGGKLDPFYQRKPVPDSMIHGIGDTGLSREQEYINRERKYSVNGVDVRKFSDSSKGGWHPSADPFYGRKPVHKAEIDGVGETNMTKAEEYENHERKAAMFDLSNDPFQQITGSGHRQSIAAGMIDPAVNAARRRSSAVAPDMANRSQSGSRKASDAAPPLLQHHSGYDGDQLAPIQSVTEGPPATTETNRTAQPSATTTTNTTTTTTTTTTALAPSSNVAVKDDTGHSVGSTGHTTYYDAATAALNDVGSHGKS